MPADRSTVPPPRSGSSSDYPKVIALDGLEGDRLSELVLAIQRLSLARSLADVQDIVKHAARELARADGATFILRDGDKCFYVDEDAISPLWKGRRFPADSCVSGWAMQHRVAVSIPDVYADDRVPQDAYRPTFVRSMLMTPIRTIDPLGAIGVYWAKERQISEAERNLLHTLADTTAVAMESIKVWDELERRVAERTVQLATANAGLAAEVAERRRAERRVRELSLTDDLTGVRNRRGFLLLAGQAQAVEPRSGEHGLVVFVDIDGLKAVNDTLGHTAGDQLLCSAADVLRRCFRDKDVIGRVGGDEFAVYVPHTSEHPTALTDRIAAEAARANETDRLAAHLSLSVGVTKADVAASLDNLLGRADEHMYRNKRERYRASGDV